MIELKNRDFNDIPNSVFIHDNLSYVEKKTNEIHKALGKNHSTGKYYDLQIVGRYELRKFVSDPSNDILLELASNKRNTIIDGVCSWSPEFTLAFKSKLNIEKDQEDIRNLNKYLNIKRI